MSPVVGVGTDVVSVPRLAEALARTPTLADRLFAPAERRLAVESLAARFAAKEALAKALGAPAGLSWHDAEVVTDASGQPALVVRGATATAVGGCRTHLSLAHDAGLAMAFVVLERS